MSPTVPLFLLAAVLAPSQPDAAGAADPPDRIALTIAVDASDDSTEVDASLEALLARVATSLGGSMQPGPRRPPGQSLLTPVKAHAPTEVQVLLPAGVSADDFLQALAADESCQAGPEACKRHCQLLEELSPRGHWHLRLGEGRAQCLVLGDFVEGDSSALPSRRELRTALKHWRNEQGSRERLRVGRLFVSFGRPDFRELDDDE